MIIAINGKAGAGKDTVGNIIQYIIHCKKNSFAADVQEYVMCFHGDLMRNEVSSGWEIKKFAGPLRKVAAILLGMEEEYLYTNEFKARPLPTAWDYNKLVMESYDGKSDVYQMSPMTGREFLQKLGTEAVRDGLHQNAWVNALMSGYVFDSGYKYPVKHIEGSTFEVLGSPEPYVGSYPNWIITDLRFSNEYAAVKERDGVTLRIKRTGAQSLTAPNHPSETSLDNAPFDYEIENNGTVEELYDKVYLFLQQINLI